MKKYIAGTIDIFKDSAKYYTDDFESFYKESDEALSNEDLVEWAVCINSPWSQADEKYVIELNCKNAYTPMDENEPIWRCEYYVVGYDCITTSVFGYGNTEAEALEACRKHFQLLQCKYNPEDESF
jgi:hypothetical protein